MKGGMNRRVFLGTGLAVAAQITIAGTKSSARVLGANERIRVAVAGLNGRGGTHVSEFARLPDVEIAYLVDPDRRTYRKHLSALSSKNLPAPKTETDIRRVLDDKSVQVVSIATPNHWHSLMTIWACQAGKDVYVEKPCSHNIYEGRKAVEAAKKYGRIVQHGTQSRSSQSWLDLLALVQSGRYGKLLVSRGLCYKPRGSIGVKPPSPPPAEVDFDLWLGPAPEQPHHANLVHYNWHWFWDFGNGDIGNQGVHQMDIARWLIPGATWPDWVISFGGRLGYRDQGETPNTQIAVMGYGPVLLIFEVRGLKTSPYYGQGIGNVLHFEEGVVAGGKFYPKGQGEGEPITKVTSSIRRKGGGIFQNFIECVRSRRADDLHAPIEEGHISSGLCHLANISYRLGQEEPFDPKRQLVPGNEFASETLQRVAEHLAQNGIKLEGTTWKVGRKLEFDGKLEQFRKDAEANALLTRKYRPPFVVPDKV
jgi:predicted dehydrogenase